MTNPAVLDKYSSTASTEASRKLRVIWVDGPVVGWVVEPPTGVVAAGVAGAVVGAASVCGTWAKPAGPASDTAVVALNSIQRSPTLVMCALSIFRAFIEITLHRPSP